MREPIPVRLRILLAVAATLLAIYWSWKGEWVNAGLFIFTVLLLVWSYFRHGHDAGD